MNQTLGQPIAFGRTATIYCWDDQTVLKVFHEFMSREFIEYEAQINRTIHSSGLVMPYVGNIVEINGQYGLIYEKIDGETMLTRMKHRPWQFDRLAKEMARLHKTIHETTSPQFKTLPNAEARFRDSISQSLSLSSTQKQVLLEALDNLPKDSVLCHGDLHPDNILLSSRGAVAIDWANAVSGCRLADVARTSILLEGAIATEIDNPFVKLLAKRFHRRYIAEYFSLVENDVQEYETWLPIMAAVRLRESIPHQEAWLHKYIQRHI